MFSSCDLSVLFIVSEKIRNPLPLTRQWRIYILKFWTPPGVQILSILCSFWEKLAKSYVGAPSPLHLKGGRPKSGKFWIRHCKVCKRAVRILLECILVYYHPQRSCGKIMFLHVSLILFTEGRALCQTPTLRTDTPPWTETPSGQRTPHRDPPHGNEGAVRILFLFVCKYLRAS